MSEFLSTLLRDIQGGEILALIDELEQVCSVRLRQMATVPLVAVLTQSVYPAGPGPRMPISIKLAPLTPILETRIGKLPNGDLRALCMELARLKGTALEFYQGNRLHAFLNKTIPQWPSPLKKTATQTRRDAVVQLRRSNRRQPPV